ncbi:MAG: hypothetical protein OEQ39_04400 [Gammaproteobacteria bacterium]|nr:hypothetical protein [Gammaproteobacteria bacterium]
MADLRPKFTPKPGNGSLFKNKFKKQDNHPDYTGNCTLLDGRPADLAAWIKEDKNGNKFMSIKISEQRESYEDAAQPVNPQAPLDDEVPW